MAVLSRLFFNPIFAREEMKMRKLVFSMAAGLVFISLILAACTSAAEAPAETEAEAPAETEAEAPAETEAEAPAETEAEAPAEDPGKACLVTDVAGVDDRSFNATAWKGVTDAGDLYGWEGAFLESQQQTDYERNLSEFAALDCDLIITR